MADRLISVPAAKAYIEVTVGDQILKGCMNNVLDSLPAVDAVPVVRCKDCKFFEVDEDDYLGTCSCGYITMNHGGELYPERSFFCFFGERRKQNGACGGGI